MNSSSTPSDNPARGLVKSPDGGLPSLLASGSVSRIGCTCDDESLGVRAPVDHFAGGSSARLVAPDTWWVGGSDKRLALFENAYPLLHGVAYNSYLIVDEKVVLIDTADRAITGQFFENVSAVLENAGRKSIDYVVVNHMEPDHSSALGQVLARFPEAEVVCTGLAAKFIGQFFDPKAREHCTVAAEGDVLLTGRHALAFVEAPWVHWPEVMMTYDAATGVLFSADAFGTFNALDGNIFADQVGFCEDDSWLTEARRYYCNIVGKYGPYVQNALAKAATLDISVIAPAHGPLWRRDLPWILGKYDLWSRYEPEDRSVVIFCASVYGGTESAANMLAAKLSAAGVADVRVYDVSKTHRSHLLAEAFRASNLVFASITYNNGIFTEMRDLLHDLGDHHLQNRRVSFVENGTWHANSAKLMRELVSGMPGMVEVGTCVLLKSTVNDIAAQGLSELADAIARDLRDEDAPTTRLSDPLPAVDTTSGASKHS